MDFIDLDRLLDDARDMAWDHATDSGHDLGLCQEDCGWGSDDYDADVCMLPPVTI